MGGALLAYFNDLKSYSGECDLSVIEAKSKEDIGEWGWLHYLFTGT